MSMNWQDLIQQAEEGGTYVAIPDGSYQAFVQDATTKSASTGKQMIVAVFEVLSGPHKGRRVWNNFTITRDNPNALAWFFKHMAALGLDKSFFAMGPSIEAVAAQMKGKQCVIDVASKVWNGETRNDIKKIAPLTGAQATGPMGPSPAAAPAPVTPTPEQPAAAEQQTPPPTGPAPTVPF